MAISDTPAWMTIILGKLGQGLHGQSGTDRTETKKTSKERVLMDRQIKASSHNGHKYYGEVV